MIVVAAFHGADLVIGGSTFTAVLDVAFGAAALGFAAGLQRGWVEPPHRRDSGASSRMSRHLRNPSARVSAAAGVGTHLPGLIYLVALNAIASDRPALIDAGVQVAVYNVLWFLRPHRIARAGGAAPRRGPRLSPGGHGVGPSPRSRASRRRLARAWQLPRREGHGEPALLKAACRDQPATASSSSARAVIACSVRMVVSMSATSNWLEQPVPRAGDGLAQAAVQGLPLGRQVELRVAADQPLRLQPGEQLARRVGVQGPRALEVALSASRASPGPRVAISCRAYQVSGSVLALGEVPAQHGRQRPLGEGQGLAELAEGDGWLVMTGSVDVGSTGA